MIKEAFMMQLNKKYLLSGISFFIFFMVIYFIIDYLNMPYYEMTETYGIYLVAINIFLNATMSLLSALLLNLTTYMSKTKLGSQKGENLGFFAILFGILTYGCTSCVIAFLGAIGIAFSVTVLPLAGLPYKLISLFLILIGLIWVLYEINKGVCKIK